MSQRSKSCLIGIPDHQGIINLGGRIGAAEGPRAFRRVWPRLHKSRSLLDTIVDLGDVSALTSDVSVNHRKAAEFIARGHRTHGRTIVIGGGHDHGFSLLQGVLSGMGGKKLRLGCLNIDAHLDLRKPAPLPSSGSPFYLAIESGVLDGSRLVEFGVQSHCNAPDLWEYARKKKIKVIELNRLRHGRAMTAFRGALRALAAKCDAVVLSLDLDAAAEAYSPGVSAPQSEGFTSSELIEMCEVAGAMKKVVALGIFELNPAHDIADRTARLAATAAYHFLD